MANEELEKAINKLKGVSRGVEETERQLQLLIKRRERALLDRAKEAIEKLKDATAKITFAGGNASDIMIYNEEQRSALHDAIAALESLQGQEK